MGCGASSSSSAVQPREKPNTATSTTNDTTTTTATNNPENRTTIKSTTDTTSSPQTQPSNVNSKVAIDQALAASAVHAKETKKAHETGIVGPAIEYGKIGVDTASTIVDGVSSALSDAQAAAVYKGQAGDAMSAASGVLNNVSTLAGMDDLKRIAAGGWVLVSESAKFFTIGKVAVAILEQIYNMWNAWDSKTAWVGEFIAFLKLVETDLVAGMKTFKHVNFLKALEAQLEQTRDLLAVIQRRGKAMSFIMAMTDQASLKEHKEKINARKQECLFGHAVDIKEDTKESRVLFEELAKLIAERNAAHEAWKACPEGPIEREKHMKHLRDTFAMIDPSIEANQYQTRWMVFQRRKRFKKASDEERQAYIKQYLSTALRSMPSSEAEVYVSLKEEEQARSTLTSGNGSSNTNQSKLPTAEELAAIAAKEREAYQQRDESECAQQIQLLQTELKAGLTAIQTLTTSNVVDDLDAALLKAEQVSSVLTSLKNLIQNDTDLQQESIKFTELVVSIRHQQLAAGLILPHEPSLDQLQHFNRIVTKEEREFYLQEFRTYYAHELSSIEWAINLASKAPRTPDQPSKGRILVIKPPPPSPAPVPADPNAPRPPETKNLTTTIFLSFLPDLYPRAFRALHFTPDQAALSAAIGGRHYRQQQRELANLAAIKDARHQRNVARREKLANEPDSYPEEEEDETVEPEEAAWKETPETAATLEEQSNDAIVCMDSHRLFPSLAFQLAQHDEFGIYYSNLLSQWSTFSREQFSSMNPTDFIADLFGAKFDHEGHKQENPNQLEVITAADGTTQEVQQKICLVLDAAQFITSNPADMKQHYDFDDLFLTALDKHVKVNLPPWMTFVLTVPHQSRLDKRVTGIIPLTLSKEAMNEAES